MQQTSLTLALSTPNPQELKTQRDESRDGLEEPSLSLPQVPHPRSQWQERGEQGPAQCRAPGSPLLFLKPPFPQCFLLTPIFLHLSLKEQALTCRPWPSGCWEDVLTSWEGAAPQSCGGAPTPHLSLPTDSCCGPLPHPPPLRTKQNSTLK